MSSVLLMEPRWVSVGFMVVRLPVTRNDEEAPVCGCSRPRTLCRHVRRGFACRLLSATSSAVSHVPTLRPWRCNSRTPGMAFDPESSYWTGATQATSLLGVNVSRLNQLVAAGRVPFELHADGRRMYRREQMLTVANAREARWR